MQLEAADILACRSVGGAIEKCGKALAAVNVAPLRAPTELPCVHFLIIRARSGVIAVRMENSCRDEVDDTRSSDRTSLTLPTISTRCRARRYSPPPSLSRSDLVLLTHRRRYACLLEGPLWGLVP